MPACVNHPHVETDEYCWHCGTPLCGNCLVPLGGKSVCAACRDQRVAELQRPAPAGKCGKCGTEFAAGEVACRQCGAPTGEPNPRRLLQLGLSSHLLVVLVIVGTVFGVAYRVLTAAKLNDTYAFFVGLPLMLGVLTAYLVPARKGGLGMTLKVTTAILCGLCPILGEGAICLLMAVPLFYGVAVVGWLLVAAATGKLGGARRGIWAVAAVPFLIAGVWHGPEGITNAPYVTSSDWVVVAAPADGVRELLQTDSLVTRRYPAFLRAGFPLPTGMETGADGITTFPFDPGPKPWPGSNRIRSRRTALSGGREVRFDVLEDGTRLAQWIEFKRSTLSVEPVPGGCRVRHTTTFRSRLQPVGYWTAVEAFGVGQMHRYALDGIRRIAESGAP